MTRDILAERGRALEYEFFHRLDQLLVQRMRETLESEKRRQMLAEFTGIADQAVLDELVAFGLRPETLAAFSLFPLVQVAWANGCIHRQERLVALGSVESVGCGRGSLGYRLMEEWLNERPNAKLARAWRDYVAAFLQTLTSQARRTLGREILERARQVACAAGGVLGIRRVSAAERRVLAELEQTLVGDSPPSADRGPPKPRPPRVGAGRGLRGAGTWWDAPMVSD
jgi:hypothetical protein